MQTCEFCEISKNTFSYGTPPVAPCKGLKNFYDQRVICGRDNNEQLVLKLTDTIDNLDGWGLTFVAYYTNKYKFTNLCKKKTKLNIALAD